MPITLPNDADFSAVNFRLTTHSVIFESPLSRVAQVLTRGGPRWEATFTVPPCKAERAGEWQAFLLKLRGPAGQFWAYDPAHRVSLGLVGVGVAATTGPSEYYPTTSRYPSTTLYPQEQARNPVSAVTTATVAQSFAPGSNCITVQAPVAWDYTTGAHTNYEAGQQLKPGDYIQIGAELKMVIAPVPAASNHDQINTICFEPPLREPVLAGDSVQLIDATCVMRLPDDLQSAWSVQPCPIYTMSFSAVEVL